MLAEISATGAERLYGRSYANLRDCFATLAMTVFVTSHSERSEESPGRVVYRGLYARKNSPILTVARFYVVVIIEISAFEFRFVRLFDGGAGMNRLLIGLFVAVRRLFVGNYLVLVVFHFYFFKHTISTAISAGFTPDMREA